MMKAVRIFLLILIIIGLGFIATQSMWVPKLVTAILQPIPTPAATNPIPEKPVAGVGVECHDSPNYFAIQQSLADSVGSNIVIKYKTSPSQTYPCEYAVATGDFEIKNVLAEYFLTFTDNFLVLDSGTAPPPRGLIVYSLSSRKIVYTDLYDKPVTVEGDSITYLSKTSQKPTLSNCPQLHDYTSNDLGAVIMSKVTVDLATLTKKDSGMSVCIATQ